MEKLTLALLCDTGCEEYAALEVKELLKKECVIRNSYVVVKDCAVRDAAILCYQSQTASRVLVLIDEGKIAAPEDTKTAKFLEFDYPLFMKPDGSFRVETERSGEHDFQSPDVEMLLGKELEARGLRVELKKPDMRIFCRIRNGDYILGIDLAGRDLGKRDYKVFHTRQSMRGTVMYAAVRAAGYSGKGTLVDPWSNDGTVAIEAAFLTAQRSPQRFRRDFSFLSMPLFGKEDWPQFFAKSDENKELAGQIIGFSPLLRMLQMARQNAKLASVEDAMILTRCDLSWLDTKLEKNSADFFVTVPPTSGKSTPLKDVEQLQEDLFKQAAHSLKKNGSLLLVVEKKAEFLNAAERHGFALSNEKNVWMGGKELLFLRFEKVGASKK